MYEPIHIRRPPTRRRVKAWLITIGVALVGIVVAVVVTMAHPQPASPVSLDQLEMLIPDSAQTELVAQMVRTRIDQPHVAASAGAKGSCSAPGTPHRWDSTQRQNATTIVQVGMALGVPERGEVVALAAA